MKRLLVLLLLVSLQGFASPSASMASTLTLDGYLSQVKGNNPGVRGTLLQSEAGQLRSEEGKLLLSPTFFANAQWTSDAKLTPPIFIGYDSLVINTYSVGVSQQTTFGLQAKLHYDLLSQYYNNPIILFNTGASDIAPGGPGINPFVFSFTNASPVLELTQNLWGNGFGRTTRATQEQVEAQALASSYNSSFQTKSTLVQAETSYWRLALARQSIQIQKEALDRARKIYEWNANKARLQLAEKADVLQADALVQTRELEMIAAQNEERSAARDFNSLRNIDSDHVEEQVIDLHNLNLKRIEIPKRASLRDDVKAAYQNARVSTARSVIATEQDTPTLDAYASLALNGEQGYTVYSNITDSMAHSLSLNRPTRTIGIRFSMPIAFDLAKNSREGWKQERIAAEMNYDRKLFEQEQNWKSLNQNFNDATKRLELSEKLEMIQKSKLETERKRLDRGRSTTYQVLLFEQDYLLSQLTRLRDQASILNVIAQMKLFGENV